MVRNDRKQARLGFSLVEVIVVLAIMAILIGLILPAVQRARLAILRVKCGNNLRNMGLALHMYHDANSRFPKGSTPNQPSEVYPYLAWTPYILPYIEQDAIWQEVVQNYTKSRYPFDTAHEPTSGRVIKLFTCPADDRTETPFVYPNTSVLIPNFNFGPFGPLSYMGNAGMTSISGDGVLYWNSFTTILSVTDGTSNTLLVGERPPNFNMSLGWWYCGGGKAGGNVGGFDHIMGAADILPANSAYGKACGTGPYSFKPGQTWHPCDAFHFWSLHDSGGNFLFVDGSVHFLNYGVAPILPQLATRAGGEVISMDF